MTDYRKDIIQTVGNFDNSAFAQEWFQGQSNNLSSIFNEIKIWNEEKNAYNSLPTPHFHAVGKLNIDEFNFPTSESLDISSGRQAYWTNFKSEFDKAKNTEHPNTLIAILKKYLWCIPAKKDSDISLYEHIRLKIAREAAKTETPQYWLVCGDVTGIQSYIYGVAHAGAMKALKGRSFWLNQIVESLGHHFIESFDLPSANLIYASGGKFYALIPFVDEIELKERRKSLQLKFKETYEGDLGLALAWVNVKDSDLDDANISTKWQDLSKELEKDKYRKFGEILNSGQNLFSPFGNSGQMIRCQNTKKDICTTIDFEKNNIPIKTSLELSTVFKGGFQIGKIKVYELKEDNNRFVSSEQYSSQLMGRRIKTENDLGNNRNVVWTVNPHNVKANKADFDVLTDVERFDFKHHLEKEKVTDIRRALMWNSDDFINIHSDSTIPKSWNFYGGNWRFDDNLPFDKIIQNAKGIKRMGVLRLDLDNLGFIFRKGFEEKATFERVVQLSLMLDFFFSGFINRLRDCVWTMEDGVVAVNEATPQYANEKRLSELIEIVYSGGDDVFIVGVWHVLPDVALWLNKNFHQFTGFNETFTMSAGITLFDDKFPLFKAAKEAGEAEDRAKSKRFKKGGKEQTEKNAVCFLDTPMSWKDFQTMRNHVAEWYDWMENGRNNKKLNHGFINRLLSVYGEFESLYEHLLRIKDKNAFQKALFSKWRWHACYNLYRYAALNKAFEDDIKQFASQLFVTPQDFEQDWIALLKVPALWLDLLTRKEE